MAIVRPFCLAHHFSGREKLLLSSFFVFQFVSYIFLMLYATCLPPLPPSSSTFVCPTEIIAFNDRIAEFQAINTEVVACSVDSKYTHLAWINQPRVDGGLEGLKIPLLSDLTKQISKDYGVLLEDAGHTLR